MKYARIVNNTAVDTRSTSPEGHYTPNIVAEFVTVPDTVMDGWSNATGAWLAPPVPVAEMQPVINFTYPVAAAKTTQITVDVAVVNAVDNLPLPITKTYYVPLISLITGVMDQMLVVPIVDGVGQAQFSVATPGIYSIATDMTRPKPTAMMSETPDIAIY